MLQGLSVILCLRLNASTKLHLDLKKRQIPQKRKMLTFHFIFGQIVQAWLVSTLKTINARVINYTF